MSLVRNQIVWAAFYLREEAEARFRLYLEDKLVNAERCKPETREMFTTTIAYLAFLSILYGDLNEAMTAELELNKLKQSRSFPEYLARFTRYTSQVAWDERARMARLYEGLKPRIKDAMAI
jgi:hypothetical protein